MTGVGHVVLTFPLGGFVGTGLDIFSLPPPGNASPESKWRGARKRVRGVELTYVRGWTFEGSGGVTGGVAGGWRAGGGRGVAGTRQDLLADVRRSRRALDRSSCPSNKELHVYAPR
jgi:hypothetical protein